MNAPKTPAFLALLATAAVGYVLAALAIDALAGSEGAGGAGDDTHLADYARLLTRRAGALQAERARAEELEQMAAAMAGEPAGVEAGSEPGTVSGWQRFPRTTFALARRLVVQPDRLAARELYRNRDLNPRDRRFGESAQQALQLLLASYQDQITAARAAASETARKELDLLIDAGRATTFEQERFSLARRPVGVDGWTERRRTHLLEVARKQNLDPHKTTVLDMDRITGRPVYVFKTRLGKVYSANIRELPLSRRIVDVQVRLLQDLGSGMLAWAGALGLLQHGERTALADRVSNECAAWLARLEGAAARVTSPEPRTKM